MYCKQCGIYFPGHGDKCPSCKATEQASNQTPSSRAPFDWRQFLTEHKRLVIIVCCVLAVVFLFSIFSGPSIDNSNTYAPDQLIRYDIAKKFGTADLSYSVDHNMDETTHIDIVTVKVVKDRNFSNEHFIGTLQYRYNKSDDTWDSYGDATWRTDRLEYLAHKFTTIWDGNFENSGGSYNANITSVDFENGTITGRFSASYSSISLSGSQYSYTLETEGTYPIEEDYDGYWLVITQSGCKFTFLLSPHYGFTGVAAKAI